MSVNFVEEIVALVKTQLVTSACLHSRDKRVILQFQVADVCSGQARMRVYEAANATAKNRVIEGHETHVRSRLVFHDQNTCLRIELEYRR